MNTVGIVSPGAMGSAVGAAYLAVGNRAVTTVAGRSARTRSLAERAGLELLPDLDAVVSEAALILSIAPPDQAIVIATELAAAASRTGARPLVADCNAVSPTTARELERILGADGVDLVDASISGGPPREDYRTRLYVSGPRSSEVAAAPPDRLDVRVVGNEVGIASAVKMCTASVYKGHTALLVHALSTAAAHGVLPHVLDDLHDSFPRQLDRAARLLAVAATKAERYVGEMREIAATQANVGLTPALFEAMAEAYSELAQRPLAAEAPEAIAPDPSLADVLEAIRAPRDDTDAGERT